MPASCSRLGLRLDEVIDGCEKMVMEADESNVDGE